MDDQHSAARLKARRVAADGFLGRITYVPAEGDEGIGQMRRNRAKDETPHFQQVTPFTQWCAPTRIAHPHHGDMRPSQAIKSQKHWLLEYLPEASINDEDTESLLLEEIATAKPGEKPASGTAPLFSVGEISDMRESESVKGHQVLALASGISGTVLRIISLAREEWVWNEADIRVRLHAANPQLEGEWCQDGVPISLVRFAIDPRKNDPIRWLLVQNGLCTTVYEPELRMIPMPAPGTTPKLSGRSAVSQIFANPLVTIPSDRTGGSLQSDVCFARHPDTDTPQLAIIDQAGYWSLWDITGRRNARPKVLTPVLKICGNTSLGYIPKLPSSPMAELQPHRILWLSLGLKQPKLEPPSRAASRTRSPSAQSRDSPEPASQPPRRFLLLCNPQTLHLFDVPARPLHSVTHLVLPKETHRILGVAPSRLDPAQAFILTNTSLLWVAGKEGQNGSLTLDILASCPHQRDATDPTLRLDVSPGAYLNNLMACFVCVRSARDTEMTVFWFIHPDLGGTAPARYHRALVALKDTANFVGLAILPAARRMGEEEPASAAGRAMRAAQLRFFQLLTLGPDLDVHSALCAWSDARGVPVLPPDTREALGDGSNRRLKLLQSLTDAFAVPDEFDERVVFGRESRGVVAAEGMSGGIQRRVDFGLVAQRLCEPVEPALVVARDGRMSEVDGVDLDFIAHAVEREKKDEYMPRHSLLDLVATHQPGCDLLQLAREWDAQQDVLYRRAHDWLFLPEARRPLADFGPDDLVERLRDLFGEPQPSEDSPLSTNRDEVLQNMAAEMFLSNIGVSAVPPAWTTTADEPPASSLPFPSSPTLMPSQPSLPSFVKSSKGKGKDKENQKAEQTTAEEQGDAVALRLRQYATLNTNPTIHGEPALALSRWDLGADPDEITWKPGQDLEAEEAINRRRRKIEGRRRRAERLSQRIFGGGGGGGEDSLLSSSQSFGVSTQSSFLPPILTTAGGGERSSQVHSQSQQQAVGGGQLPWEFSSQQQQVMMPPPGTPQARGPARVRPGSPLRREYRRDSAGVGGAAGAALSSQLAGQGQSQSQTQSQGTPSQPRSQVLPGLFGGRPSFSPFKKSPLKKGKRKSELRMSGFR